MEHDAEIKLQNEISRRIRNYINDLKNHIENFLITHSLNEYQGKLDWYHVEYSHAITDNDEEVDNIEKTKDKLEKLINKIGDVVRTIESVMTTDMDFYGKYGYILLVDAVTLQITTYSELIKRCDYHTGQLYILESQDYLLERMYEYYSYSYEKSYNSHNHTHFDTFLNHYDEYKDILKKRKELEHLRYIQLINLNHDFKFINNDKNLFAKFIFDRCSNFEIKKVDDVNVLAVNNKDGQFDNPSIAIRVFDIPEGSEISFEVDLKSNMPNRKVRFTVFELKEDGNHYNDVSSEFTLGVEFETKSITSKKLSNATYIKLEIYWYDKDESDLIIKHRYINFTKPETILSDVAWNDDLPLPDYLGFENMSTSRKVYFHLDSEYSSSLYYAANDGSKKYETPCVFYDLNMMASREWEKLNVTFEIFLKTREHINREIQLSIQERIPNGRDWITYDTERSEVFTLTDDWKFFSITCNKQHYAHARLAIFWFDHRGVDIMMRDPKAIFFLKQ